LDTKNNSGNKERQKEARKKEGKKIKRKKNT
jgi:hypothetical protein